MAKRKRYLSRRPKSTKALNQAPGTLTYVGRKENTETILEVIDYNAESYERHSNQTPEAAFKFEEETKTTWININGLSKTKEIEKLGKYFELHPLIIEDIVNTNQRPKIDEYQDYFCLLYTSPSPRDRQKSRMPSSA